MPATLLEKLVTARYEGFLRDLELLVNTDCGSWDAAGVNKVADYCARRLLELGCTVDRVPVGPSDGRALGDVVVGRRQGGLLNGRRILLLSHMDTVFEDGTAAARPFHIRNGRAHGPGVTDDKAGLLAGLTALETLIAAGAETYREVVAVFSPDEEIGAPGSRGLIEQLSREADVALCLECAREDGAIVKARKGIADVHVDIRGRPAHAGIEPERGASAALAAAGLVIELERLNGGRPGVSVNVGVIRAGSRANIVCPQAHLEAEVRATTRADLADTLTEIDRLAARLPVPGTAALIRRRAVLPPMEADGGLVDAAVAIAAELGLELRAVGTGGVADANLAAACGTPTLDGLGPVGGGDHTPDEWLDLSSVVPRTTVLAALIARLGTEGSGCLP
ncbi:M20 family metallopeptidase [Spirillospora sp. NPDC049024]